MSETYTKKHDMSIFLEHPHTSIRQHLPPQGEEEGGSFKTSNVISTSDARTLASSNEIETMHLIFKSNKYLVIIVHLKIRTGIENEFKYIL